MTTFFVGLDPGVASGAIACIDREGAPILVQDAPWLASAAGGRKEPDIDAMLELFDRIKTDTGLPLRHAFCWLEETRPYGSKVSRLAITSLASSFWAWRVVLKVHGVPTEIVSPRRWRKVIELPVPRGQSQLAKRDAVLAKARGLFPSAPLERKKDNGRAAALLIAHACRMWMAQ